MVTQSDETTLYLRQKGPEGELSESARPFTELINADTYKTLQTFSPCPFEKGLASPTRWVIDVSRSIVPGLLGIRAYRSLFADAVAVRAIQLL